MRIKVALSIIYSCVALFAGACGAVAGQPSTSPHSNPGVSSSPVPLPTALSATAAPISTDIAAALATQNIIASPTPSASPTAIPTASILRASLVLTGHTDWVNQLAWSPDGTLLASSAGVFSRFDSADLSIRLWRPDGTLAHVLTGHTQRVTALAWSPDGKSLATGSLDETIRVWQPDGTPMKVLRGHTGQVFAVAWSPDGKILASGSLVTIPKSTVQWWSGYGQIVKTLSTGATGGKFNNLAWSPNDGGALPGFELELFRERIFRHLIPPITFSGLSRSCLWLARSTPNQARAQRAALASRVGSGALGLPAPG